jgi:hypothetical protein
LVVVAWPSGPISDAEIEELLRTLARFYGRAHAVLHDGVRASGLTANQRRRMAQHAATYEEEVRRWVIASAAVATSPVVRGLITAVQWVAPSPCPFKAFSVRAEAEEWLLHALRRAGVWRPSPTSPTPA